MHRKRIFFFDYDLKVFIWLRRMLYGDFVRC